MLIELIRKLLEDALALVAPLANQEKTFETEITSIRKSDEFIKFSSDVCDLQRECCRLMTK